MPMCLGSVSKFLLASLCLRPPPVYRFVLPWSTVTLYYLAKLISVSYGVTPTSSLSKVKSSFPESKIRALLLFFLTSPQALNHLCLRLLQPRLPLSITSPARSSWFVNSRSSCASTLVGTSSTCIKSLSLLLCNFAVKFEIRTLFHCVRY